MIHFHPISEPISPTRSITSDDGVPPPANSRNHRHVKSIGTNNASGLCLSLAINHTVFCFVFSFFHSSKFYLVFLYLGSSLLRSVSILACFSDIFYCHLAPQPSRFPFLMSSRSPLLSLGLPARKNLNCKCNTSNHTEI